MDTLNQTYDPELPVEWIRANPLNPNEGDEASLTESIDEIGFFGAVLVRQTAEYEYELIGGEHRVKDRRARGIGTVPAIIVHDIDEEKALKALLADNEVTRRGSNNVAKLNKILRKLPDIRGTGFPADIEAQLAKHEDERRKGSVPEVENAREFPRQYGLVIECEDEATQEEMYNAVIGAGIDAELIRAVSI